MTRRDVALGVALVALPAAVWAHSPVKGLDSFYSGLLHPLFVPAHLLAILATGCLIGQQGARRLQSAVVVFLGAAALGLALTVTDLELPAGALLLACAAVGGLLIAAAWPLPPLAYAVLAACAGFLLGADSAQDDFSGGARTGALLGTGIAVYLLMLYALVFADWFNRRPWQQIGLRVLGSWVAASALLVLALQFAA